MTIRTKPRVLPALGSLMIPAVARRKVPMLRRLGTCGTAGIVKLLLAAEFRVSC